MKTLSRIACASAILGLGLVQGCDKVAEAKVPVEKLPEVKASLPGVPTLPPPPYPTQYGDQTYSVYGLRRALRKTIDQDVTVTGYISKIYVPPECPPKTKCPLPPAPHIYVGDTASETDDGKLLIVAGYAENQKAIDDAIKEAKTGAKKDAKAEKAEKEKEEAGLLPIPIDFFQGAKIKVKGRFSFISGSGFQSSEGVLNYSGHETLEPSPEMETAQKEAVARASARPKK
ncbi:MAG: hypothetical protein ACHQ53_03435 [Polyangiales bacterium]